MLRFYCTYHYKIYIMMYRYIQLVKSEIYFVVLTNAKEYKMNNDDYS